MPRCVLVGVEHATDSRLLEPIPRARCLQLLATASVGRVVFTEAALPAVHPVNFAVVGGDVVLRTGPGHKLDAARRGDVLAFQTDRIDDETRTGWSVLVVGHAAVVDDIDELVAAVDPLRRPWLRGRGENVVRITAERVTGRLLALGEPAA